MSLISGTKTDDDLKVPGQRGELVNSGAQPSCRTLGDPDGVDRGEGGGKSSQQRMEERTGADLREFVIAENVYGERQEPPPPFKAGRGVMQRRKNIITQTPSESSFIRACGYIFFSTCASTFIIV